MEENKLFFQNIISTSLNKEKSQKELTKSVFKNNEDLFPKSKIKENLEKMTNCSIEEHENTLYKVITFIQKRL